ncbi:MAG: TonB-dependent receptor domain-containing protein [Bacteroidota bacterium]
MIRQFIYIVFIFLLPCFSFAQQTISGEIKGNAGVIPGATVRLIDTEFATVSDHNGIFTLEGIPTGEYHLEVRFVGFKTHTQKISTNELADLQIYLSESSLTFDEVVVTGSMQPTFVSQSPVKIDVVTSNYLQTYLPSAATGIVEAISLVNGVQEVVACGVCFTNSISINGLPGPYTAILMDGSPIYGNLASVYGLNGIPSMIIDRFEVIKGPSSTLYGSEAVAGVINIITKDPKNQPPVSIDVMGTSHMESFGNFSFAPKLGKSSGYIGMNYAYINDFDDQNNDGFSDNVNLDRISLFTKWDIYRQSGKRFDISAKYYYEDRRNGVMEFLDNRNYLDLRGDDQVYGESIFTKRAEVFGTYELPWVSNVNLSYSLSKHEQDSYYGDDYYIASQDILFSNLIWDKRIKNHDLLLGITNRYQVYDDNTIATKGPSTNVPQKQYIPGIFVQDEWSSLDQFTLLGGLRMDHYKDHGFIFAPRLNIKYKPGEWTTIRSNFGTGFRIVNLFAEDHAFVTGQREVVIQEELLPEESYNFSLNLNHVYVIGNSQGMIDIDAFYTHFTNKITPNYDVQDQIIYANSQGFAVSKGIGINIQHQFQFPLSFNLGVNFQEVTEHDQGIVNEINFSPDVSGVFTTNYRIDKLDLTLSYTARYTGSMKLPEVYDLNSNGEPLAESRPTTSNPFSIHNIQLSKNITESIDIYGGIQNIFDYVQPWSPLTGFNDPNANPGFSDNFDTAYAYSPIHGREVYVGIKWSLLNKK